jgi:hypothetical protein
MKCIMERNQFIMGQTKPIAITERNSKITAFIEEEKRTIDVWTIQVGKDFYFVQELTELYHDAPKYTTRSLNIDLK